MPPVEGRRFALVVFGTPALLLALLVTGYVGVFALPGAPCNGAEGVAVPDAEVAVAANDSAVTVVYADDEPLDSETTDRVVVAVRDANSDAARSVEWVGRGGTLERGDSLTVTERDLGFRLAEDDTVTVRWYGVDPGVAEACPNGRAFGDLTVRQVGNASVPISTG